MTGQSSGDFLQVWEVPLNARLKIGFADGTTAVFLIRYPAFGEAHVEEGDLFGGELTGKMVTIGAVVRKGEYLFLLRRDGSGSDPQRTPPVLRWEIQPPNQSLQAPA